MLCSDPEEKMRCIAYISQKLVNSGFKAQEISDAKIKALSLDRSAILTAGRNKGPQKNSQKQLTFLINRDDFMSKAIKKLMKNCNPDINKLLGTKTRIIIAERKNSSIASAVFAKSSFSKNLRELQETQECNGGHGRKCCEIMKLERSVTLWKNNEEMEKKVTLDFRCDCNTEHIIYMYVCNLCPDNDSFYIGQSVNSFRDRANGHRGKFSKMHYKKSALSCHVYKDHPLHIDKKLNNYRSGVIKSTTPVNLDRLEDYYVEYLDAKLSLNRYKVTARLPSSSTFQMFYPLFRF